MQVYLRLLDFFGPQHWWPGETPFEIVVGAVLTQNTNWQNVCKAIDALKEAELLTFEKMVMLTPEQIAPYIRSAGYYNLKARRLHNLLAMINEQYEGVLEFLFADDLESARHNLLLVKGIGPETADSILLYGGNMPTFVVDTYTHRVFSRHHMLDEEMDYYGIQQEFVDHLDQDVALYNEYHALIVAVGKDYCKKSKPLCDACPLHGM